MKRFFLIASLFSFALGCTTQRKVASDSNELPLQPGQKLVLLQPLIQKADQSDIVIQNNKVLNVDEAEKVTGDDDGASGTTNRDFCLLKNKIGVNPPISEKDRMVAETDTTITVGQLADQNEFHVMYSIEGLKGYGYLDCVSLSRNKIDRTFVERHLRQLMALTK